MTVKTLIISTTLLTAIAAPAFAQTATGPSVQERNWSQAAQRVGAFSSRAWANRGAGVTIAIVDSGVRRDHIEFTNALSGGFNALTNQVGLQFVNDTSGHGSHVAALAAGRSDGRGMVGVASAARILPVQVFAGNSTSETIVARGITWATSQRAFVVNLSLGSSGIGVSTRTALQNGVKAGQLFVVAAGNEGQLNPSWPARHASEAWARGQILAVGAVDANNQIASFSNRAGDARNFYLVAPGVNLISAYHVGATTYAGMSGTSMAAPVVAGAAAVVKGTWPQLSAASVAQILLTTATDLGARGVDPVFGRGMLNLERALQPVGNVTRTASSGAGAPVGLTGVSSGPVFAGSFGAAASSGALHGVAFDQFNRDFDFDYGWLTPDARPDAAFVAGGSLAGRMVRASRQITMGNGVFSFSQTAGGEEGSIDGARFGYTGADGSGWTASFGDPGALFGRGADSTEADTAGFATLAPVFGDRAVSVAAFRPLSETVTLRAGVRVQDTSDRHHETQARWTAPEASGAASAEVELHWATDVASLSASVSALHERDGRLGAVMTSDMALAGSSETLATSLSAAAPITERLTLSAQVTAAITGAQSGTDDSLLNRASQTTSTGWEIGLNHRDTLVAGDRLTLSAGSPLTSSSGHLAVTLPVGADPETGAPILENRRISLASQTPERRFEASYIRSVGDDASFGVSVMSRNNADGYKGRDDHAVAMRFSTRF